MNSDNDSKSTRNICFLAQEIKSKPFFLALGDVLDYFETNKVTLMKDCCLDSSCIYKYLENKAMPMKRTLLLICIAAGWPVQVSYSLLFAAGFALNSSVSDVFFDKLLHNPKALNIYQVNELIEKHNKAAKRIVIVPFKM